MTIARSKHWRTVLGLSAALAGAPIAACASGTDAELGQVADELKGGVPNSANGKGKANNPGQAAAAGSRAQGTTNEAGSGAAKTRGKSDQAHGQGKAGAAGAAAQSNGQGKGATKANKGNSGMANSRDGGADEDDMGDETDESGDAAAKP